MHMATAVSSVFSPASTKYFFNMFAPNSQPTAINVIHQKKLVLDEALLECRMGGKKRKVPESGQQHD